MDKKPHLPLPGQVKFKLVPVDKPYKDPTTGIEITHTCPELINPSCPDCKNGWMEVAYGKDREGNYDVYRFRCKCEFPDGFERLQLSGSYPYSGKPVAYTVHESQVPGHVLIHPVHAQDKMTKLRQHLRRRADELGKDIEDLPF